MAQADLERARIIRGQSEQEFVDSLEDIYTEATVQWMEERMNEAEAAQRRIIERDRGAAGDPAERAIEDALLNRWDKEVTRGLRKKHTEREFDKDKIDDDWDGLFARDGGPKAIMRRILVDAGFTSVDGQIDDIMNNPEFVAKMQPKVVERLVTRRIQTGKITETQARFILDNDWGVGMIEAAIQNKKGVQEAIDKLRGDGVLKGEGVKDWIKHMDKGKALMVLLIVLGLIVGGVAISGLKGRG